MANHGFCHAVLLDDVNRARNMLQAGHDVNKKWIHRPLQTPIAAALQKGENDMSKLPLEHSANVNQVATSKGETPLHLCASMPHCSASKAQLLLFHGAEVGSRDNSGRTPLHSAAAVRFCSAAIAELLMENGADLGAVDRMGCTPLHCACMGNNENEARFLIERGTSLNIVCNAGFLPIDFANLRGRKSLRLVLMEAHARGLLAVDNAHPGLWAQVLATVGHKKTPGRLSLPFSLLQKKPDLFNYLPQEENPRKRKRSD